MFFVHSDLHQLFAMVNVLILLFKDAPPILELPEFVQSTVMDHALYWQVEFKFMNVTILKFKLALLPVE